MLNDLCAYILQFLFNILKKTRGLYTKFTMQNGDYTHFISSHRLSSVDSIYKQMKSAFERCNRLSCIEEEIYKLIPCVQDSFSRLRYIGYFMQKLLADRQIERIALSDTMLIRDSDSEREGDSQRFLSNTDAEHPGIAQLCSMIALHRGKDAEKLLRPGRSDLEILMTLCTASIMHITLSLRSLLSLAGRSVYIDSLIRHIFRTGTVKEGHEETAVLLHDLLQTGGETDSLFTLALDMASEHGMAVLGEAETADLLKRKYHNLQGTLSLLRYIGECGFTGLLPELHRMLGEKGRTATELYCIIDVLAQLGHEREIEALEYQQQHAPGTVEEGTGGLLADFIQASIDELKRREGDNAYTAAAKRTIAQCMFYGDILHPGQAGGGGLTTFLNTLGNNLAEEEVWHSICTLVLVHPEQQLPHTALFRKAGDGHFVVGTPVSFPSTDFPKHFAAREYEIMRSIRRTLERYSINPDLFHLRYSDNASAAVVTMAKRLGKQVVFTLTPDPHRNFIERDGRLRTLAGRAAMRNMSKVFVADRIVENADGIVLIGHRNKNNQILPYFPQLWLDNGIRRKPLRIMAEGVRTSFAYLRGTRSDTYIDLLLSHEGKHRLTNETLSLPLMLNVGRLDPMKGQRNLIHAWATSTLSRRYCLVLIGGNITNPDSAESELLEYMDRCMERHPHLRGRFCHIPALPNPEVRLLEQSITDSIKETYPNLYVCSSYKEEFGISILEAMASGFLVAAPLNGGVSSYVTEGETGFLIDTENAETIKSGLLHVLDPAHNTAEALWIISRQGRKMVKETFNIKNIAKNYSVYYQSLVEV